MNMTDVASIELFRTLALEILIQLERRAPDNSMRELIQTTRENLLTICKYFEEAK